MKKSLSLGTLILGCCLAAAAQMGSTPNQTRRQGPLRQLFRRTKQGRRLRIQRVPQTPRRFLRTLRLRGLRGIRVIRLARTARKPQCWDA